MENIYTFEAGVIIGSLAMIVSYTFVNLLLLKKKFKENEELLHFLQESQNRLEHAITKDNQASADNLYDKISTLGTNLERRIENMHDHFTETICMTQERIEANEISFEKELRFLINKISSLQPASPEIMINS